MSRSMERLAKMTENLRRLIRKDVQFEWNKERQTEFDRIKEAVANIETLGLFDPKKNY